MCATRCRRAASSIRRARSPEALDAALGRWSASGLLGAGAGGAMAPEAVAATIWHVITSEAHIDDIAVMDHA